MIRLGHIDFSNCIPVHALLLGEERPDWVELRSGMPAELNAALAAREIDVAPSSSIEYARHAPDWRILPGLCIAARGAVRSILLESDVAPDALAGRVVALPTASATSVVMLRALLEIGHGLNPRYVWFDQSKQDPFELGAAAALWIGDGALLRRTQRRITDMGSAWHEWTGLPFVYALWQTSAGPELDHELAALHQTLSQSLTWAESHLPQLAVRHAARLGVPEAGLAEYWRSLVYRLDDTLVAALLRFYAFAAELGEARAVERLSWFDPSSDYGR